MRCFVASVVLVALSDGLIVAGEMMPFKGSGSVEAFIDFVNPDPDCGSLLTIRSIHRGQATQLGSFTAGSIPCVNPLDGSFFGKLTSTAANGDELYTRYVGQFQPDPVPGMPGATLVLSTMTIEGGTGRFENATGSYENRELITASGATFEFEGEISSVGSSTSAHAVPEPTSMSLALACFFGLGVRRRAKKRS